MKIALVGAGVIARVHMKALLAIGTLPAAICDIDPKRAQALLEEFSPHSQCRGPGVGSLLRELDPTCGN